MKQLEVGLLIGSLVATLLHATAAPQATKKAASAPQTVRAQKFELVDQNGRVIAAIETRKDGTTGLNLFGKGAEPVASLVADSGGDPILSIRDKDGRVKAAIGTRNKDGITALSLFGKGAEPVAALLADREGSPILAISDKDGNVRTEIVERGNASGIVLFAPGNGKVITQLTSTSKGSPMLVLEDPSGNGSCHLSTDPQAGAGLNLTRSAVGDGFARVNIATTAVGGAVISLRSSAQKALAVMSTNQRSEGKIGTFGLWDEAGNRLFAAP